MHGTGTHASLRAYTYSTLGMAMAVRIHATPRHAACGGGLPSGLKVGALVVGMAATEFAVTDTPHVCVGKHMWFDIVHNFGRS